MKDFLSIRDLSANHLQALVKGASQLKAARLKNKQPVSPPLVGKSMAMIFDKPSLRTRLSFEVGMTQLGGHAVYLAPDDIQLGARESVADSARVIASMADCIIARISNHESLVELAKYSKVPVINAMTDFEHPCQILADLQTIYDTFHTLDGLTLAYIGDADNNVTNSLAFAADLLGITLKIAAPPEYALRPSIAALVPSVQQFEDPDAAVTGADVVITDTWVSMGKESDAAKRLKILAPYQVTEKLMRRAHEHAIFMHCLPAYRGKEVDSQVIDGPQSVVFEEAENRLYAQQAVVLSLLD